MRFFDDVQHYLHLDYGPCGIDGPTDPVIYEDAFVRAKVEIPRKCRSCPFLFHDSIHGFTCRKDQEKWGHWHRGLDWGSWRPDRIYLDLGHSKITTKALIEALHDEDLLRFITEYRRVNPGLSLREARGDFQRLRTIIDSKFPEGSS